MPRFSRIRTGTLEDLAGQLRFAPRPVIRRQIGAALKLAAEIDPARTYAEDWIVRRITGYQPKIEEPGQLVGEAVLGDLSAFLERISAQSKLAPDDLPKGALGADELCARWNVSRKTLERYRRRGLVGVRTFTPEHGQRLMFPAEAVGAFESRHASLLVRAGAFARIDEALRPRLAARAERYIGKGGLSLNQAAARLAERFELSHEGVRQLLMREGLGERPDAERRGRRRALAFRAWRFGIAPSIIVKRLGRTRAAARAAINAERMRRLAALDLAGPAPSQTDSIFLSSTILGEGLGAPGEVDVRDFLVLAAAQEPPDAHEESLRAEAYHFLRGRAAHLIRAGERHAPSAAKLDEIETTLRWAALLKIELVRSHRAIIIRAIEERSGEPLLAMPSDESVRWIGVAISEISHAIDRYDASKGGRLAAPLSMALGRALAALPSQRRRSSSAARRTAPASAPMPDWSRALCPWQSWLDPLPSLGRAVDMSLVSEEHIRVIRARFGRRDGPPMTAAAIHATFGITPARLGRWLRDARRAGWRGL